MFRFVYAMLLLLMTGFVPCSIVMAQGSPNVTLLKQVNDYPSTRYNDCWGYIAPDGREYALLGVKSGTSIIDITDAANAAEVAFVSSSFSSWKDIKTYGHYAYTITETNNNLQVIDLSNLPVSASLVNTYVLNTATDPHNIFIDEAAGILYVADDFHTNSAVHVFSLADPLNPVFLTDFGPDCHDMYARNGVLYVAEGGNGSIGIFDVSNPASPSLINRISVPSSGYVHNVWPSDDAQYLMSTEETSGKTVKFWDISNTGNPTLTDTYLGSNNLAHNAHIKGDFAYISHYQAGLRIVDISDPANIFEADYYDTPDAWGAWPFFDSGKVLISDINSGLYVVYYEGAVVSQLQQADMSLSEGWNLVGLPNAPVQTHVDSLFPAALENTLFAFEGGYVSQDTLAAGQGYWLRFPANTVVPVSGMPVESLTLDLNPGWNLISGISSDVPLDQVIDDDGIIVPGTLYGFSGTYELSDTIRQGRGYWLRANAAGQATLDNAAGQQPGGLARQRGGPDVAGFGRLQIIEQPTGHRQTLYVSESLPVDVDQDMFSLPPRPQSGALDARFAGDLRLSAEVESIIEIQSGHFPLDITLDNVTGEKYRLSSFAGGQMVGSYALSDNDMVTINNPLVSRLVLNREGEGVPLAFNLHQNYPNPFNPNTVIRYTIGASQRSAFSDITLVIYNTLGQEVRVLVAARQEAGTYAVQWDGRDASGREVASGIYLYRMSSGSGTQTRRMLLLR